MSIQILPTRGRGGCKANEGQKFSTNDERNHNSSQTNGVRLERCLTIETMQCVPHFPQHLIVRTRRTHTHTYCTHCQGLTFSGRKTLAFYCALWRRQWSRADFVRTRIHGNHTAYWWVPIVSGRTETLRNNSPGVGQNPGSTGDKADAAKYTDAE